MKRTVFIGSGLLVGTLVGVSLYLEDVSGSPGSQVEAEIGLSNENRIVGMQFNLAVPPGQAEAAGAIAVDGMERHRVTTRMTDDRLKVVVHSPTNAELPSGGVLSIPLNLTSGSPDGGPSLGVENLIFTDATGRRISGAVFYHPLEAWRQERFSADQRRDPDVIGDFRDPDGDGYPNVMEFLFATDPLTKDPTDVVRQSFGRRWIPGEDGESAPAPLVYSFEFPITEVSQGAELWIETSTDLVTWSREDVEAVTSGGGDRITLRMETDPAEREKLFFRVRAARVADADFVPEVGFDDVGYSELPTGRATANLVEMETEMDGEGSDRRFFRFEVTKP